MKKALLAYAIVAIALTGLHAANPDFRWISPVQMNPAQPEAGQVVTFRATFKVVAANTSRGLELLAGVDGQDQLRKSWPMLVRGHVETVMFTWKATPGHHAATFHLDPEGRGNDINPGNNFIEAHFQVPQGRNTGELIENFDVTPLVFKPNFVVENVRLQPETAVVGEKFNIYFHVANVGEGKSLRVPGIKVRLNNLPPVKMNRNPTFNGNQMKPGDKIRVDVEYHMKHVFPPCKLEIVVDEANRIAEMDENDNRVQMPVPCIRPVTENLKVVNVFIRKCPSGTNIFQFKSMYDSSLCATLEVVIRNEGSQPTPPGMLWDLNVWGEFINGNVPQIQPGQTKRIYISGKCGCGTWFDFKVDSTDMLKESNENDNSGRVTMYDCT